VTTDILLTASQKKLLIRWYITSGSDDTFQGVGYRNIADPPAGIYGSVTPSQVLDVYTLLQITYESGFGSTFTIAGPVVDGKALRIVSDGNVNEVVLGAGTNLNGMWVYRIDQTGTDVFGLGNPTFTIQLID